MSATRLHLAAFDGDIKALKALLADGAEVDARSHRGETPLLIAAMRNHADAARLLIEAGADVNALPVEGSSALRHAVRKGNAELTGLLLAHGADPARHVPPKETREQVEQATREHFRKEAEQHRQSMEALGVKPSSRNIYTKLLEDTPEEETTDLLGESSPDKKLLSMAIQSGNVETLKLLLDAGMSPNASDKRSSLSLLEFARMTQTNGEMQRLLLEYGADPNGIGGDTTPLQSAILRGDVDFTRTLLDAGARTDVQDSGDMGPLATAVMRGVREMIALLLERGIGLEEDHPILYRAPPEVKAMIAEKRGLGWWQAVRMGDTDAVRAALSAGAEVNAADSEDGTALFIATNNNDLATMRLLLAAGADTERGTKLQKPLPVAASAGNADAVRLLLEYGADIHATTAWGQTPLLLAATQSHDAVADLLLENGATLELPEAILLRRFTAMDSLLEAGASVAAGNPAGMTPLHAAVHVRDQTLVRRLLNAGAPVDPVDRFGRTPLALAVALEDVDMAQLLLARGASPAGSSDATETPLRRATQFWNADLVRLLLKHGAPLEQPLPKHLREKLAATPTTAKERAEMATAVDAAKIWTDKHTLIADLFTYHREYRRKNDPRTVPQWEEKNRLWTTVEALIDSGADANTVDGSGASLLASLIEFEAPLPLIEQVIEKGAYIHPLESAQAEPLSTAVEAGRTAVVMLLLRLGCDPNAGRSLESPLQVSVRKQLPEIAELLEQYGASDEERTARLARVDDGFRMFLHSSKDASVLAADPFTATKTPDFGQAIANRDARRSQELLDYRQVLAAEAGANEENQP